MVCGSCGRAAKPGARFCGGCGASLATRCPACGAECEPDLRFCEACGASLAARPAEAAGARKVVTIVFADLVGSTSLHERLDAEAVRQFMEGYYAAMQGAVEAQGGRVTQRMGDGVKAVFGAPRVAEDDALRAVRAAVEMQRAFRALADEQRERVGKTGLRVAVNTGEVVADGDSEIIGDPVNVAARLQEQGRDGDVVIGGATQRVVAPLVTLEPLGSFALKGRSEAVEAYRVVSLERPAGAPATPFVGREDELGRLRTVFEAAVAAPAARLAVVLGSPGLGKSRLLDELARELAGRARVLTAHCNPAGGATFAPLAEALRATLDSSAGDEALRAALAALVPAKDDAERAAIAVGMDALLAGKPALPEEIFFVVRRLLSALAAEQPVVLAVDDLQWAEPLLLDFTEHLVQWGAGVPLLVLVAARPELRDARSSFTRPGGLVSEVVTLGGLDAGAAMRLAANVIGAETLPAAVAGRVLTASEGNPLFVGELVRMLVNDGALQKQGEQWSLTVELAALDMPPTIQALLAARIERLRPEERLVLERAAVVGRRFSRTAVTHLLPREAHADLDAKLEALRRSELIEPDAGWLFGEPALRFHHTLIRDAAYRRVLRGTRAELHARFADWLEARAGASLEHEETIGWHLEQAHRQLRELGPLDAAGRALGERAGKRLGAAGQRALARDDLTPAASLLGRALECLDPADAARAELALDWCEALLAAGEVVPAAGALAELGRFSAASARLAAWHTCFGGQLAALADPKALRASAESVSAAAEALAAAGDVAGEAKAHAVHADALARLGQIGACEAALDKALAAARRVNDRRRANAVLAGAPLAALWGPSPVTRASGRCLDVVRVLRITQGAPAVEAVALRCQAVLETLRGRSDAARRMLASSRRLVEELGITQRLLEVDASTGLIELLEGHAVAAERSLLSAYEGFRARGLGVDAARAAALLGRALLAQGRAAESETLSRESEALAGDDFKAAIGWRGVRAEALAARGEHAAALELARAAVEIAAATDDLLDHADARSALAGVLRAAGRGQEAAAEEARALELWEQKGATLLVERARRGAERVVSASSPAPPEPIRARPRVRPSAATAICERFRAVSAARDLDALDSMLAENFEQILHATGVDLDKRDFLVSWRSAFRAGRMEHRLEATATLGDSLVLGRESILVDSLREHAVATFGPSQLDDIFILEADAQGLWVRAELFAPDRLGDAIARLYERHAELLPEGPERTLATATARSVATLMGGPIFDDLERFAGILAPDVERIDHRSLSLAGARGREALVETLRVQAELSERLDPHVDDVLGVRPDALLLRWGFSGTLRDGGGTYEQLFLLLICYGAGGLVTRTEWFGADRDDDALARLEELTAGPREARPARRRVRTNSATACEERVAAAVAARDLAAIGALLAPDVEVVSHAAGTSYDRKGALATFRGTLRSPDLTYRLEPLASLGDRLALGRQRVSGSGSTGAIRDLGAYEAEFLVVTEADDMGRRRRFEMFAPERLGDAVARLYERYAELLPEGAERVRAAATARSVAVSMVRSSADRYRPIIAPDIAFVDHRTVVSMPPFRGASEYLRRFAPWFETVDAATQFFDDVVDLRPTGVLVRRSERGGQQTGGDFENVFLVAYLFDGDGRLARTELFDGDREAEAFARFDELAAGPPATPPVRRRVRPNAATTHITRLNAASRARDLDAAVSLLSDRVHILNHTIGVGLGRQELLDWWRLFFADRDGVFRLEPLATLGESLALVRQSWTGTSAGGALDIGAFEMEMCLAYEVDAEGRVVWAEAFWRDRPGDALVRLYERHAELLPAGPEKTRAEAIARSAPVLGGRTDLERFRVALSPDVEFQDHRVLGLASARGSEVMLGVLASLLETAPDSTNRIDDVLALESDAFLVRVTNFGTSSIGGGPYERPFLIIWTFGADGLVSRSEQFDVGREAEALARFDELTAPRPEPRAARRVRPNAATANAARLEAALAARASAAIAEVFSESAEALHHPTGVTYDKHAILNDYADALTSPSFVWREEILATLGDSLSVSRSVASASGLRDFGAFEIANLLLREVDGEGRGRRAEFWNEDRLDDAIARLYGRYAERLPDGAERERAAATARSVATVLGSFDPERWATAFAPTIEALDHRTLGTHFGSGASAVRDELLAWREVAADLSVRYEDVLELAPAALLERITFSGADRAGGGVFERPFLRLLVFGGDGLLEHIEWFDPEREAEALARFDELMAGASQTPFANAAWRVVGALDRAMEQRDWNAVVALEAPGYVMDDRRALVRSRVQGDASLANLRLVFDAWRSLSRQLVATRGERLALDRQLRTIVDRHGGVAEFEYLGLNELDATGRLAASVLFDPDDLDAAYAELDARYGAKTPMLLLRSLNARDWDAVAALLAPDLVVEDHRRLGWGTLHGPEAYLVALRALVELAPDATLRLDHLEESGRVTLGLTLLSGTREGGAFEDARALVVEQDAEARIRRIEFFERDQLDAARARYAALSAPRAPRIENAATRTMDAFSRSWDARDWEGVVRHWAPSPRLIDRRPLVGVDHEGDEVLASIRLIYDQPGSRWQHEVLATRGERLGLLRWRWLLVGEEAVLAEVEYLGVVEVDADGRQCLGIFVDAASEDAAYAELDARYAAGEAAPHARTWQALRDFGKAFDARDWQALARSLAPDFAGSDRRRLGRGGQSGAELVAAMRALAELAPDARLRAEQVLALDERRVLVTLSWVGSQEGGLFEIPTLTVAALDPAGRFRVIEGFDLDQLDAARARYAELAAATPTPRIENAATRNFDRVQAAWEARDWERLTREFAPEFRGSDRRPTMLLELDRDQQLAFLRMVFDMSTSRQRYEVLATRGERLALARLHFEGSEADAGPSEIESLIVIEVNERGERIAAVRLDPGDLTAAYTELDARYAAGEAAPYADTLAVMVRVRKALAVHDWERVAALYAEDFVQEDHRSLGLLNLSLDDWLTSLRTLGALRPDARFQAQHMLALDAGRSLSVARWVGSEAQGAFETPMVVVNQHGPDVIRRSDVYDLEQMAEARARYEALGGSGRDPLAAVVLPNAAWAALDRLNRAFEARDWAAVRGVAAAGARFEDRRRHLRDGGDVDWLVANLQLEVFDSGLGHYQRTLLATAGDRVCLSRTLWSGGPVEGRLEIEFLTVAEVDESGRLVAGVTFDVEDRGAASREVRERWLAGDPEARALMRPALELIEALNERDRARARDCLADDIVLHDRRLTGVGLIEGAGAYLESIAALWALAPEMQWNPSAPIARERHGWVAVVHTSGTLVEGGAFERPYLGVMIVAGGRVTRIEMFELEETDAAVARLAELRPDPHSIPPNAATGAADRWHQAAAAGDREFIEAFFAPTLVFEDRRRSFLTRGDREMALANERVIWSLRPRPHWSRTVLATAGERLALLRSLVSGANEDVALEVEFLQIVEVDCDDCLVANIVFDADDRRAASRELLERWENSVAPRGLSSAVQRAILDRDLAGLRAALPADFVFHDHRHSGAGRIEGADAYVAWTATLLEASPDAIVEPLYYVAIAPHAFLAVVHNFGTLAEGGAFESVFVALSGDGFTELFELDDLERARARFEALRPDAARIPPNAASRTMDRANEAWRARDWAALRAFASPDLVFEDRTKRALLSGGVEMWLENARFVEPGSIERERIASAGERIVLERFRWTSEPEHGPVEREHLRLTELDPEGRIRASLRFDLDDRAAAFAEAAARFVAGEGAEFVGQAPFAAVNEALAQRDWEALRKLLSEDLVYEDRRPPGLLGRLDREGWIDSLRALDELAPDWGTETLRLFTWNGCGRVMLVRLFGTREGGPFENLFVNVALSGRDRLSRMEIFDLAESDRALARFAELCAKLA